MNPLRARTQIPARLLALCAAFLVTVFAAVTHAAPPPAKAPGAGAPPRPVKIIFDTDMGNDIDDALALAMMHALQTRGVCELLAITHTNSDALAGPYTAAINAFYGRPDIPIGVSPNAPFVHKSRYLDAISKKDAAGKLIYPSPYDARKAMHSVELLRRVLAGAADGEVVIVQVGFSTNLAQLLSTPADAVSPLTGRELVRRKVKQLSVMAGAFPVDTAIRKNAEFNVIKDIPAARTLVRDWPTPIVWSGWELGNVVRYPAWSIDLDFAYIARHPIQESYQMYNPTPHERPCWDLTSVACVLWPERGYFDFSEDGAVTMTEDGRTTFIAAPGGRDRYIKVNATQAQRLREVFAALASEPPRAR